MSEIFPTFSLAAALQRVWHPSHVALIGVCGTVSVGSRWLSPNGRVGWFARGGSATTSVCILQPLLAPGIAAVPHRRGMNEPLVGGTSLDGRLGSARDTTMLLSMSRGSLVVCIAYVGVMIDIETSSPSTSRSMVSVCKRRWHVPWGIMLSRRCALVGDDDPVVGLSLRPSEFGAALGMNGSGDGIATEPSK